MGIAHSTQIQAAPLRAVEPRKPFFGADQLAAMAPDDLVALVLSLQTRTFEMQTAYGPMVCVQRLVPLIEGKKEDIFDIPYVGLEIQAKGWRKIKTYAGAFVKMTPTVMVNDQERSNPCPERDGVLGSGTRCWVRMVGVWRGPNGVPTAVDLTLCYDPGMLLVGALGKAMEKNEADIKRVSRRLADDPPEGWAFFPETQEPGTARYIGLLVKLSNKAVHEAIKDRNEKAKFIDRYAVTFCERNLLKKLIPVTTPRIFNGVAAVPVTCWVSRTDETIISEAYKRLTDGQDAEGAFRELVGEAGSVQVQTMVAESDDDTDTDEARDDDEPVPMDRGTQPARSVPAPQPAPAVDENGQASMFAGPGPVIPTAAAQASSKPAPAPAAPAPAPAQGPNDSGERAPSQTSSPAPSQAQAPAQNPTDEIKSLLAELRALADAIGRPEYDVAATNRGIEPTKPAGRGLPALRGLVEECRTIKRLQEQERAEAAKAPEENT